MEKDIAKFFAAAFVVAAVFDIGKNAGPETGLVAAAGKALTNLFAVLTGQKTS